MNADQGSLAPPLLLRLAPLQVLYHPLSVIYQHLQVLYHSLSVIYQHLHLTHGGHGPSGTNAPGVGAGL